jgi:hypothetical protein
MAGLREPISSSRKRLTRGSKGKASELAGKTKRRQSGRLSAAGSRAVIAGKGSGCGVWRKGNTVEAVGRISHISMKDESPGGRLTARCEDKRRGRHGRRPL